MSEKEDQSSGSTAGVAVVGIGVAVVGALAGKAIGDAVSGSGSDKK